ncbi:amino acid ABC transporter substrate-binding protein [Glaciecola sp. 1036]|uniref:amino acid ABC transporter substrate-binding protein n=1 Tax=Alteromonadaceae TaxID=72275 RepID=UPI003CFDABFD
MLKILVSILLLVFSTSSMAAVWEVIYPQSPLPNDERYRYPLALLDLALEKTGVRYEIIPSSVPMRQAKSLKRLEENLEINILWSMTDIQREQDLLPIRIPITKGLIGWRMFLVHSENKLLTTKINSFDQLLKYKPVQGIAWPDTKILQANGFNVVTARDYLESRNLMLEKVADFFPRSVVEISDELDNEEISFLRIKQGVAIKYPTAMYFFVNKRNKTMANLIQTGLDRAIADGSFDALFFQHFKQTLLRLGIDDITYFELENPLLPIATPIDQELFWFKPEQMKISEEKNKPAD